MLCVDASAAAGIGVLFGIKIKTLLVLVLVPYVKIR